MLFVAEFVTTMLYVFAMDSLMSMSYNWWFLVRSIGKSSPAWAQLSHHCCCTIAVAMLLLVVVVVWSVRRVRRRLAHRYA